MQDKLEQFHRLLAEHQATGRHRYPGRLRAIGLEIIEHMLELGHTRCEIAQTLGIPDTTFAYWRDNHLTSHQMVPVTLETQPPPALIETSLLTATSSRALTLTSPTGYRIEGLELVQAIELIRALS